MSVKNFDVNDDPVNVFQKLIGDSFRLFKKCSNEKIVEMNEKGANLKQLDDIDVKAFLAANLWMDTKKCSSFSDYYSKNDDVNDKFLCRLRTVSGLSARSIRRIFASTRLHRDIQQMLHLL